jgi:hypothetical protein
MVYVVDIIPPVGHQEQGFYLDDGTFPSREEARTLALLTGKCKSPDHQTELFSEDLW